MRKRSLQKPTLKCEIFSGWKDIAAYLGKGVRTIQRYERTMGLPIRRPAGKMSGAVLATKAELDAWLAASPLREALPRVPPIFTMGPVMREFGKNLKELHRLRNETELLRGQVIRSLELLHTNLRTSLEEKKKRDTSSLTDLQTLASFDSDKIQ